MELSKESLLNLQLFTDPLTKNFIAIEEEFRRVNDSIAILMQENQTFRNLKDTVQKLIENNQISSQSVRPRISKQSLTQKINQPQDFNSKHQSQKIDKNNDGIKPSQKSILPNDTNSEKRNSESIQLISEQEIDSSVLNDATNTPQMSKQTSIINSTKENKGLSRQQASQGGKRTVIADSSQSHRNQLADNRNVSQQMVAIKERLEELQANQTAVREQIQKLEKQNQKFSKMLGIKRPAIKQKTITEGNQSKSKKTLTFSKKQLGSKKQLDSGTQNQLKGQENTNQQEQEIADFGCFKELKDDIQKIRDYLSGKMKAIDANFAQVNIKINGIERSLDILQRTDNSLKQDIESLEKTANETKLNITDLHQKSIQLSKSRYNKYNPKTTTEQNEQTQKDQLEIQERIMNLLDEMERLKEQYNDILFGKGQTDGTKKQADPQMIEKRKRLALKLNSNPVPDEKLRKDLSQCRRDLKKLRQQFDYLMSGVNSGTNETKTFIIKPNETKEEWKSLSTKINKFKTELQSQIKQLEGKITANNELTVVLNQFEVGIEQCKILLKKKLDIVDFDKTTKRIENRLNNFIRQTFEKEGYTNEQDAILSKQPWFCLSCDVELKTYSGKMSKQNPVQSGSGDKFVGKKVNPESHMVRRNENGRLPSIGI